MTSSLQYAVWSSPSQRPPIPSREQLCRVRVPFQGFAAVTQQYGVFPAFGPETSSLNDTDLSAYLDSIKALGYTHCEFAVSWNYDEPGFQYPVPGRDLSRNLGELTRRIRIAIEKGLLVVLFCAGDGESVEDALGVTLGYNDPNGWTYGRQWLLDNFSRIYRACERNEIYDLTPYMVFSPGYDGVWYGWRDADAVRQWCAYAKSIVGDKGACAIEYGAGIAHLGDGTNPRGVDVLLFEGPVWPERGDQIWQVLARDLGPQYRRPPDQPAGDDPAPPYLWTDATAKVVYEFATYAWVRGELTARQVNEGRSYYASCGADVIC